MTICFSIAGFWFLIFGVSFLYDRRLFRNSIFLPENYLIDNIDRIRNIPTYIVQGRYDLVCPVRSADDLSRAWPQARYTIIPDAGHSAMEPGTRSALVAGMEAFKSVA